VAALQAVYGSPIADAHLALFEALLDGGDIVVVHGRDRKYAIVPEENFSALTDRDTPGNSRSASDVCEGGVERAYVRAWEALNWVRFYVTRLPERLRKSEAEFKAGAVVDLDLLEEIHSELNERLGDVICAIAELNSAAVSASEIRIKGRKEAVK